MTNWSDITRHNRYRKHNNTSNVGNASKRQKETIDVMRKSEECENDGFFDDNHLYSTVAPDVDKMLRFQLPGPPDFSKANAVSQNFFASENAGTGLGCALLVGQSQFQLTNMASKMQPKEVLLQIEIAELAYNISTEQRRKLAAILNSCEEVLLSQRENTSNTSSWPTSIPRSLRDICSFYLRVNGQLFQTYHVQQYKILVNMHMYPSCEKVAGCSHSLIRVAGSYSKSIGSRTV